MDMLLLFFRRYTCTYATVHFSCLSTVLEHVCVYRYNVHTCAVCLLYACIKTSSCAMHRYLVVHVHVHNLLSIFVCMYVYVLYAYTWLTVDIYVQLHE